MKIFSWRRLNGWRWKVIVNRGLQFSMTKQRPAILLAWGSWLLIIFRPWFEKRKVLKGEQSK